MGLRWLSVVTDLRIWAGLVFSGVLMFATVTCLGWSFSRTLVEREERLSTLSPEERMEAELRTIDRLGRELAGVELGQPGPVQASETARGGEVQRLGPRRADEEWLVPAWAAAGGFGLGILALGAAATFLVLRRTGDDEDPEPQAPDEV